MEEFVEVRLKASEDAPAQKDVTATADSSCEEFRADQDHWLPKLREIASHAALLGPIIGTLASQGWGAGGGC